MARMLTEDQEKFAAYAWMLAQHRAALAKQVAAVDEYLRESIRAAERYGVKQKTIAALTELTPARISQIINDDTPSNGKPALDSMESWRKALDDPQEHLARLSKKFTTSETMETWNTRFHFIYNKDSGLV